MQENLGARIHDPAVTGDLPALVTRRCRTFFDEDSSFNTWFVPGRSFIICEACPVAPYICDGTMPVDSPFVFLDQALAVSDYHIGGGVHVEAETGKPLHTSGLGGDVAGGIQAPIVHKMSSAPSRYSPPGTSTHRPFGPLMLVRFGCGQFNKRQ
ncbi:hypothetical protein Tsubulata_011462 [Turnera subulata]|uniref:Uncharacterized protein n=1 Tax=Turnera subulata TaxID=218843 RepID=A0A9Q0GIG9_9ROSI|nr:hypothetical protein Tsubulata_011462 [Turnera subulata]